MEIQLSLLRSYHAFAKSHPLISVTFSTPTPGFNSYSAEVHWKLTLKRLQEREPIKIAKTLLGQSLKAGCDPTSSLTLFVQFCDDLYSSEDAGKTGILVDPLGCGILREQAIPKN